MLCESTLGFSSPPSPAGLASSLLEPSPENRAIFLWVASPGALTAGLSRWQTRQSASPARSGSPFRGCAGLSRSQFWLAGFQRERPSNPVCRQFLCCVLDEESYITLAAVNRLKRDLHNLRVLKSLINGTFRLRRQQNQSALCMVSQLLDNTALTWDSLAG